MNPNQWRPYLSRWGNLRRYQRGWEGNNDYFTPPRWLLVAHISVAIRGVDGIGGDIFSLSLYLGLVVIMVLSLLDISKTLARATGLLRHVYSSPFPLYSGL